MTRNYKAAAGSAVAATMSIAPLWLLRNIELAAQLGQGKGWGTATVTREVKAALSLLSPEQRIDLVALDIGANVGNWTEALIAACPGAKVHAYEPGTVAFERIEQRLGSESRVSLHRCAFGREAGVATLWSDVPGSVLASLDRRRLDHHGLEFSHSEEVTVTTLDATFETISDRPSLVKMDVEGREFDVLTGGGEALASVQVVQFEFGGCNIDSRTYFQDYWYLFKDTGFDMYRIGPRGVRLMKSYSEGDECFRTTNFYAARPKRHR